MIRLQKQRAREPAGQGQGSPAGPGAEFGAAFGLAAC